MARRLPDRAGASGTRLAAVRTLLLGQFLVSALLLYLGSPPGLRAQSTASISGRVIDQETGAPIHNAVVSLEGSGSTLTDRNGHYRITGVLPGQYALTIRVIGYSEYVRDIEILDDTALDIGLQVNPIGLDPVEARLRRIAIRGSVEDTVLDFRVVDAEVTTSLGHVIRTDSHGSFRLESVYDGYPFRLRVRAFGYLPLDEEVVPEEDGEYRFAMMEDSVVTRWVSEQSVRLEERASPRFVVGMPDLDREELLGYAGTHTAYDALIFEYGPRKMDAVRCVVIDEKRALLVGPEVTAILRGMLPEELQRIEFMFDGRMMRVYTRDFMREMVSRDVALNRPTYFQPPRGMPLCT